jgi:hypothetical protein
MCMGVAPPISLHNGTHPPSQKKTMRTGVVSSRFRGLSFHFSAQWHSFSIVEEDDAHGCCPTNLSAQRHPSTILEEDDAHGCGLVTISRFVIPFLCTTALIFISEEDNAHRCGLVTILRFVLPFLCTMALIHHLRRRRCGWVRSCYGFQPSIYYSYHQKHAGQHIFAVLLVVTVVFGIYNLSCLIQLFLLFGDLPERALNLLFQKSIKLEKLCFDLHLPNIKGQKVTSVGKTSRWFS